MENVEEQTLCFTSLILVAQMQSELMNNVCQMLNFYCEDTNYSVLNTGLHLCMEILVRTRLICRFQILSAVIGLSQIYRHWLMLKLFFNAEKVLGLVI